MNAGKIILVSTAKDLLKQDGSALLGRFFIAMIAQAALERSVISAEKRTPTFVYVDEAQEYFGDDIETSRVSPSAGDVKSRRDAVARIVARSLSRDP